MAAKFTGEFFYPVELMYFVQKLRMIAKTGLKMQCKEEKPLQNGVEIKLMKDTTMSSWGENEKNVKELFKYFEHQMPRKPAPEQTQ